MVANISKNNIEPSQVLAEIFEILKQKELEKTPDLFDWFFISNLKISSIKLKRSFCLRSNDITFFCPKTQSK